MNPADGDAIDFAREGPIAADRIRSTIRETPVEFSHWLSHLSGCQVYLKLENVQRSGSFKIRGAANFLLSLSPTEKEQGVVAASSGNHGIAVASLLADMGLPGTIFVPQNAAKAKVDALRRYDVAIEFYGEDIAATECFARTSALKRGQTFIPPYNDARIIAGQSTIGIEMARQVPDMHAVFVPVGGGGLISGIAGYLKAHDRAIQIFACQPANSPIMAESVKAGRIIEMNSLPTLSDGTAGGIEPDSITFEICKQHVDDYILLSEDEISSAIRQVLEKENMLIEGAAALTVAACIKTQARLAGSRIVLVLSGKRIGLETLQRQVLGS